MSRVSESAGRLTVPLRYSGCGFEVERLHEVQRGVTQAQLVHGGPQVNHVPLFPAGRVEAVEHMLGADFTGSQ
jgi:hypothetical protein